MIPSPPRARDTHHRTRSRRRPSPSSASDARRRSRPPCRRNLASPTHTPPLTQSAARIPAASPPSPPSSLHQLCGDPAPFDRHHLNSQLSQMYRINRESKRGSLPWRTGYAHEEARESAPTVPWGKAIGLGAAGEEGRVSVLAEGEEAAR